MTTLKVILILLLHFEGFSGEDLRSYHRVGDDVTLSCNSPSSSYSCDIVKWFYTRGSDIQKEAQGGEVSQKSVRAARMSLDSVCSLNIKNITAEDYGHYFCRLGDDVFLDGSVYLDILTISPSDPGPTKDGHVSLKCSLLRHPDSTCPENIIRWVDETGAELLDEDDDDDDDNGPRSEGWSNCVSSLKVKLQSDRKRTITCQVFVENQMKIDVHYTADPIHPIDNIKLMIIVGSVIGVVLLVVAAAVLISRRRRTRIREDQKTTDVQEPNHHSDEPESSVTIGQSSVTIGQSSVTIGQSSVTIGQSSVTYVTVGHFNQDASRNKKVKDDMVTYSAVRTNMRSEVDIDPSTIYSYVNKHK